MTPLINSEPDGRTSKDFAIEFAEYMAVQAETLLDVLNWVAMAEVRDSETPGGAAEALEQALQEKTEAIEGLRGGIYEFRKRRDRVLSASLNAGQPQEEMCVHDTPPT